MGKKNWKDDIPACFESEGNIFAGCPVSKEKSENLLERLTTEGVTWDHVRVEFRAWLDTRGDWEYFSGEMEKIQTFYADALRK